ncbi:MAG: hypothetical protein ABI437_08345 [Kofleriaceae bacterium]
MTRGELREELSAFVTKAELKAELSAFATKAELKAELEKLRTELGEDIARHMKAGFESMRQLFGVLDDNQVAQHDQHARLADRVDRLEVAVFDPPNPKP